MMSFSTNDLFNKSIDYDAMFEEKVLDNGGFASRCCAPTYQVGLCSAWLNRQNDKEELLAAFKKARLGDFSSFPPLTLAMLRAAFPTLAQNNFIGVGSVAAQQSGIGWIKFPFETPVDGKSALEGTEFSPMGVKLPEGFSVVSSVIVPTVAKVDKQVLTSAVEFCQLVTPVETKNSVSWMTPAELDQHKMVGVGLSGKSLGIDLTGIVNPPEVGQLKESSALSFVYEDVKAQSEIEKVNFLDSVTKVKWNNTISHAEYSSVYRPVLDEQGRIAVKGRDKLFFKPVTDSTPDSAVFRLVDDLNARSNNTKLMGLWYYGLSLQNPVKATIEACQFVKKIGAGCDIHGLSHGMMFAATWDKSGFGKGPNLLTSMVLPSASVVTTSEFVTRVDSVNVKEAFVGFQNKGATTLSLKTEGDVRVVQILAEVGRLYKSVTAVGHKRFYLRVPLFLYGGW